VRKTGIIEVRAKGAVISVFTSGPSIRTSRKSRMATLLGATFAELKCRSRARIAGRGTAVSPAAKIIGKVQNGDTRPILQLIRSLRSFNPR